MVHEQHRAEPERASEEPDLKRPEQILGPGAEDDQRQH